MNILNGKCGKKYTSRVEVAQYKASITYLPQYAQYMALELINGRGKKEHLRKLFSFPSASIVDMQLSLQYKSSATHEQGGVGKGGMHPP